MDELRLDTSIENLDRLISVLDEQLEAANCPMKAQLQLDVAVEEIFGNIASYAYDGAKGLVIVQLNISGEVAEILFVDEGKPFNPLEVDEPNVEEIAQSEKLGGLGIFMVKESMDQVHYDYRDGKNFLTIKKFLN